MEGKVGQVASRSLIYIWEILNVNQNWWAIMLKFWKQRDKKDKKDFNALLVQEEVATENN